MPPMIATYLIRYGLPALGAVLAIWAAYSWAHGRGVTQERERLQPKLDLCLANVETLERGLTVQNERIEALRIAGEQARKDGAKAKQKAAAIAKQVARGRKALEAAREPVGAVVTPDAVQRVWSEL